MSDFVQNVYIIGSKGIPAAYGGYESFVDRLTFYQKSENIKYTVACVVEPSKWDKSKEENFTYNNAECFNIKFKKVGPARAIFYDVDAFRHCIELIKKDKVENPIVYVLACRMGPFFNHYVKMVHKLGGKVFVNPDGHEWKRAKWSAPVRKYWKVSERMMVKRADLLICDAKAIEKYIHEEYGKYKPNTTFIAYGANIDKSVLSDNDPKLTAWYEEKKVKAREYFLVVGRFVPENNYETMIREFMRSSTKKDFVLISNVENNSFYNELKEKTGFDKDPRIKFVGTVYDQELLKKIRENAYGYFHGHEVGGTNPSLLESLGSTDLNLLLDVCFNREVGADGAIYWSKNAGALASLIERADAMTESEIKAMGEKAKNRISKEYSWDKIVDDYEKVFLNNR